LKTLNLWQLVAENACPSRHGVGDRNYNSGRAERDAATLMEESSPGRKRVTLGGDKNYDAQEFVSERGGTITPHLAENDTNRSSAIDQRTTRRVGYESSQRKRKRVEQSLGWMKMVGMLTQNQKPAAKER